EASIKLHPEPSTQRAGCIMAPPLRNLSTRRAAGCRRIPPNWDSQTWRNQNDEGHMNRNISYGTAASREILNSRRATAILAVILLLLTLSAGFASAQEKSTAAALPAKPAAH